jgi:hypothetical protein
MQDQPTSRFLTEHDVLHEFGIAVSTQRLWRHEGRFVPSYPTGDRISYRRELVEQWVREQEQGHVVRTLAPTCGCDGTLQGPAMRRLRNILVDGMLTIGASADRLCGVLYGSSPSVQHDLREIHEELVAGWEYRFGRIQDLLNPDDDTDEGYVDSTGESGRAGARRRTNSRRRSQIAEQGSTDWASLQELLLGGGGKDRPRRSGDSVKVASEK